MQDVLERYREEHRALPARVVVHKTSRFTADELAAFAEATAQCGIDLTDFISVRRSMTRLFRHGAYPPLRGTFAQIDTDMALLYTKGSVDFYKTYTGMYVPRPVEFVCQQTHQTPKALAREILALTKMNWNNTQFDGGEPITVGAARRVGSILKYVPADGFVAPRYSFYM